MSKIERELSLSVLEIIEDVLPNTKLANNQELKAVLHECRTVLKIAKCPPSVEKKRGRSAYVL